jgi:hypothetical protein
MVHVRDANAWHDGASLEPDSGCQDRTQPPTTHTIEISDDLNERIDSHREEDETAGEFIEELVNVYETEGTFLHEGYSE